MLLDGTPQVTPPTGWPEDPVIVVEIWGVGIAITAGINITELKRIDDILTRYLGENWK
jgi:hypothetical protein